MELGKALMVGLLDEVGTVLGTVLVLGALLKLGIALGRELGSKLGTALGSIDVLGPELGKELGSSLGGKMIVATIPETSSKTVAYVPSWILASVIAAAAAGSTPVLTGAVMVIATFTHLWSIVSISSPVSSLISSQGMSVAVASKTASSKTACRARWPVVESRPAMVALRIAMESGKKQDGKSVNSDEKDKVLREILRLLAYLTQLLLEKVMQVLLQKEQ
jgi:hypothetical protein